MAQILYKDIIKNKEINEFIKKGDANLATLGYTEHSKTHCVLVAERAAYLLERFGHADAEIELAKIAGYMHDIGNAVNREHHAEYGALLANDILRRMDMPVYRSCNHRFCDWASRRVNRRCGGYCVSGDDYCG